MIKIVASTLLASTGIWPVVAHAQTAPEPPTATAPADEIVVTAARRRNEDVQDTPLAVTAVPARVLQERFVSDLTQVGKLAPNLQISKNVSTGDVATIYLRGFGTFGADIATEPKVATFVDGIYQPATIGTVLDTFDVAQIEVQAGPQGTLLGKNAPIGAIYVTSERPNGDFSATGQAEYTTLDAYAVRAKVSFPIITDGDGNSILAGRISGVHKGGGDWVRNLYTGKKEFGGSEDYGIRGSLNFTPTERLTWDLTANYLASRGPQGGNRNISGYTPVLGDRNTVAQPAAALCTLFGPGCGETPYGTTASGMTADLKGDYFQAASNFAYEFDPVTLTVVTGHVQYDRIDNQDVDGTPASVLDVRDDNEHSFDQQSLEVRLGSNKKGGLDFNGFLDWVAGAYFSRFDYESENIIAVFSPSPTLGFGGPGPANTYQAQRGKNESQAVFAQAILNFTPSLSATLGVRRSWDQKSHRFTPPSNPNEEFESGKIKFKNTSFEAGLSYKIDPNKLIYVRFAEGYASGGFIGFPQTPTGSSSYLPETNEAYEIGLKTEWFNRALRFNVNLFRNKLRDLHVAGTVPITAPPFYQQTTTNAGAAIVKGAEVQIGIEPGHGFDAYANIGYLDTKYTQYIGTVCSNIVGANTDCRGVPFAFAPKWTVDVGANYTADLAGGGRIRFNVNYSYKDDLYVSDAPAPSSFQKGYGLLGASVSFLPNDQIGVELYGQNLTDKKYLNSATAVPGLLAAVNDGRPLEGGIRLTYRFGR